MTLSPSPYWKCEGRTSTWELGGILWGKIKESVEAILKLGSSFFFILKLVHTLPLASPSITSAPIPGGVVVKNLPASAGDSGDMGSAHGSGRSLGIGNNNPLQYSCLENSKDRRAWWAAVHGVIKSQTDWAAERTCMLPLIGQSESASCSVTSDAIWPPRAIEPMEFSRSKYWSG